MTGIGELVVRRVNGEAVVDRADKLICVSSELLDDLGIVDGHVQFGPVRYRVVGPSQLHPGAMLCERVA